MNVIFERNPRRIQQRSRLRFNEKTKQNEGGDGEGGTSPGRVAEDESSRANSWQTKVTNGY